MSFNLELTIRVQADEAFAASAPVSPQSLMLRPAECPIQTSPATSSPNVQSIRSSGADSARRTGEQMSRLAGPGDQRDGMKTCPAN